VQGLGQDQYILKICPFAYELRYMKSEVLAYNTLASQKCHLMPRLVAYVYERNETQIIGFVCEKLEGRFAGPDDYIMCKSRLQELHSYGVIHGDLNRFNIIITSRGLRFVDFEKSVLVESVTKDDFLCLQQEELDSLQSNLNDQGSLGKPWFPL
jgi:hypothetical protein